MMTNLVACFPMYDLPEVRDWLDMMWRELAQRLRSEGLDGVPDKLLHGQSIHELWSDPNLLISQCCG